MELGDALLAVLVALGGWSVAKLNQLSRESRDLWTWHKPDDAGQQTWKNPDIKKGMEELIGETRGMREDLRARE